MYPLARGGGKYILNVTDPIFVNNIYAASPGLGANTYLNLYLNTDFCYWKLQLGMYLKKYLQIQFQLHILPTKGKALPNIHYIRKL